MKQLNAYLIFDGNCAEAMNFYKDCLGGELEVQIIKTSPLAEQFPAEKQDWVLHSRLNSGDVVLLGSDNMSGATFSEGNGMMLSLSCDNGKELDILYDKLSAGGSRLQEPHKFFAGRLGMKKDRFGKVWTLYTDQA